MRPFILKDHHIQLASETVHSLPLPHKKPAYASSLCGSGAGILPRLSSHASRSSGWAPPRGLVCSLDIAPTFSSSSRVKQFTRSLCHIKNPLTRVLYVAPGQGFEPWTNGLHVSTRFRMGWTISSPTLVGVRRFQSNELIVLPEGIVSEPCQTIWPWLLITIVARFATTGFQQFTSSFNLDCSRKLRNASVHLSMTVRAQKNAFLDF